MLTLKLYFAELTCLKPNVSNEVFASISSFKTVPTYAYAKLKCLKLV